MNHPPDGPGANAPGRKRVKIALLMLVLIVAFYLLREHSGHVAGLWLYLLLLACPLMHLFHGHGRQRGHGPDKPERGS